MKFSSLTDSINTYILYAMCKDGTRSSSSGSGSCSWHDGKVGSIRRSRVWWNKSGGGSSSTSGSAGSGWTVIAIIATIAILGFFLIAALMNHAKEKEEERKRKEKERKYFAQIDKQINWKNKEWTIVGFKYVKGLSCFQAQWNGGKMKRNVYTWEVMDQLENQQIPQQTQQPESKPIKEEPESKPTKEEPRKIIPKEETGPYESVIPRMIRLRYIISTNDESGEIILFRKWDEATFKYNAFDFKKLNRYEDPYAKMIANRMKNHNART